MKRQTTGIYTTVSGYKTETQMPIDDVKRLYRENPSLVYSKEFFSRMQKLRLWQKEAGRKIVEKFNVSSVIDFGCGAGYYLEGMKEAKANVLGYEYMYDEVKAFIPYTMADDIVRGNCQDILDNDQVDMGFSIEVAEHILPERSEYLIANLTQCAKKFIIFSAAPPGQKGCGHINLQKWTYWTDMFNKKGWVESEEWTIELRSIYTHLQRRSKYTNLLSRMSHVLIPNH